MNMPLCALYFSYSFSYSSIFAVPSVILRASGSVGTSLLMWLFGSTVAAAGTLVFVELGAVGDVLYLG
jgi:hypothetical protein